MIAANDLLSGDALVAFERVCLDDQPQLGGADAALVSPVFWSSTFGYSLPEPVAQSPRNPNATINHVTWPLWSR